MSDDSKPAPPTYGKLDAIVGDRCSNAGFEDRFTTPCCYADFEGEQDACPNCGAPIKCTVETQPMAVCTISESEED